MEIINVCKVHVPFAWGGELNIHHPKRSLRNDRNSLVLVMFYVTHVENHDWPPVFFGEAKPFSALLQVMALSLWLECRDVSYPIPSMGLIYLPT